MKKPVILCVDDEKIVLDSLKKELQISLSNNFKIEIAETVSEAFELITYCTNNEIEIPVVISDWLMPEMKGDEFLIKVHSILPDTKKILLTGQATLEGVGNAVNNAKLYRYIAKPWEAYDLDLTISEAIKIYFKDKHLIKQQNELVKFNSQLETKVKERTAEIERQKEQMSLLLDITLKGLVSTLINVVASSNVDIFAKSIRVKEIIKRIIFNLKIDNAWEYEIAALLCQLGCLETDQKIVSKYLKNEVLSSNEMLVFLNHPLKTHKLISKIPHFENVSNGILYMFDDGKISRFDFDSSPQDIKIAKILRVALDYDNFKMIGMSDNDIITKLEEDLKLYDLVLINAIKDNLSNTYRESNSSKIISLQVQNLKVGMKLSANIKNKSGKVLFNAEEVLTVNSIMSLVQLKKKSSFEEPVYVYNPGLQT